MACVFLYTCEGLPQGVPFGFTSHPKSKGALPRNAKQKADPIAFSTYKGDRCPMPLHFYTDRRVLKAAGLSPIADADLGALEAKCPELCCDMPLAYAPEPVVVSSSSKEDEAISLLLRRFLPFPRLSSFVEPLVASILTWAEYYRPRLSPREKTTPSPRDITPDPQGPRPEPSAYNDVPMDTIGQHSTTVVLNLEDQGDEEDGIPPCQPSAVAIPKVVRKDPPPPSPAAPNHAKLISSFSSLRDKLEGELKALEKEKAREEGVLQRHLKNMAGVHTTLQVKYAASVHRTEAVRAE
ncbi:hypothetical protein LIER_17466 [Lithospermum erythrorhizon]|uniref:Uncharacterized protein n=1 Tax=Lithospermum erythrorhizon TaxID=34254 RepID=A0AAV3QAF6_LITER